MSPSIKKKLFGISLLFLLLTKLEAQSTFQFIPIKDDSIQAISLKKIRLEKFRKDSAALSGENKKLLREIYKSRYDNIDWLFKTKELIVSDQVNAYLNRLVNEIIKNNPPLQGLGTMFLFSRSGIPNAFSTGEGSIVFQIGLFSKLENESQVAFILCHELSHLYLNHSNNTIHQIVETVTSKELKEKIKEINKQKYERGKEFDKLEKDLALNYFKHSRKEELQADSMAVQFMKNTSFDLTEGLNSLSLLDLIDIDSYDTEVGLNGHFNCNEYPFQKRWIQPKPAFFGGIKKTEEEKKLLDSLKTHPDCTLRRETITPVVNELKNNSAKKNLVSESEFLNLQKQFKYEIINFYFKSGYISASLYYAMELLHDNPDDVYCATIISRSLDSMYTNQKNHTLSRIIGLPHPERGKNYNTLLEFIQNIRLDEIAALQYHFTKKYETKFNNNEDFIYAIIKSKENFGATDERNQWISFYRQKFNSGKYSFK